MRKVGRAVPDYGADDNKKSLGPGGSRRSLTRWLVVGLVLLLLAGWLLLGSGKEPHTTTVSATKAPAQIERMAEEYVELAERSRRSKKLGKDDQQPPSRQPGKPLSAEPDAAPGRRGSLRQSFKQEQEMLERKAREEDEERPKGEHKGIDNNDGKIRAAQKQPVQKDVQVPKEEAGADGKQHQIAEQTQRKDEHEKQDERVPEEKHGVESSRKGEKSRDRLDGPGQEDAERAVKGPVQEARGALQPHAVDTVQPLQPPQPTAEVTPLVDVRQLERERVLDAEMYQLKLKYEKQQRERAALASDPVAPRQPVTEAANASPIPLSPAPSAGRQLAEQPSEAQAPPAPEPPQPTTVQLEDGAPIDSQSVGPQSGEQEVEQKRPQEPQQQQPQPEEPQRADMGSGVTDQLDASTAGKQEDDGTPTPQPHRPSLIDILLSVNKKHSGNPKIKRREHGSPPQPLPEILPSKTQDDVPLSVLLPRTGRLSVDWDAKEQQQQQLRTQREEDTLVRKAAAIKRAEETDLHKHLQDEQLKQQESALMAEHERRLQEGSARLSKTIAQEMEKVLHRQVASRDETAKREKLHAMRAEKFLDPSKSAIENETVRPYGLAVPNARDMEELKARRVSTRLTEKELQKIEAESKARSETAYRAQRLQVKQQERPTVHPHGESEGGKLKEQLGKLQLTAREQELRKQEEARELQEMMASRRAKSDEVQRSHISRISAAASAHEKSSEARLQNIEARKHVKPFRRG